ncbi:glycosyltransferase family 25 protein [Segatella baroniae]|uniref:glycosyltransferase family 25 protein n=1 Tax=Segatella baroniae TaxID=305719 RepID=UPI0003F65D84|nr:glycosyltransferase family 25 protein [Segatella baroniae]
MISSKILVLHVKKGYEDRQKHIEKMMKSWGYSFEYILDGDMDDLNQEFVHQYFTGEMDCISPATSVATKHLKAARYIVDHQLDGALILEDDMLLYPNFEKVFNQCLSEIQNRHLAKALISFEDSSLYFVPGSQRKKGQHLYIAKRDRFAGALYCTREAAELILQHVRENRCDMPIDLYHTSLIQRAGLNYYWCHPCIATQGSHTGLFASSINEKSAKKKTYRRLTWNLKLAYKKLLYYLR